MSKFPRNLLAALVAIVVALILWVALSPSTPHLELAPEAKPTAQTAPAPAPVIGAAADAPAPAPQMAVAPTDRALFAPPTKVRGRRLDPRTADLRPVANGAAPAGRAAVVERSTFADLAKLTAGEAISLPLFDGRIVRGTVNLVRPTSGAGVRVGGDLVSAPGTFAFGVRDGRVSGLVMLKRERIAYEFSEQADGQLWVAEKHLGDVICEPLPKAPEPEFIPVQGPVAAVPILNSRPTAREVIYLDFDGETVTDPDWNGGRTIVAASFNLSNATIDTIFDRVKEDWFPFNINVTTDVAKYNAAPVGRRMRVIITPTNTAAPGAGGVAYLTSFRNGGTIFSDDIPCWVFNSGIVGIVEAISHEVGHTMGLRHDGRTSPAEEYYFGQGSGATGWCPIMGAGYNKSVVQWSKGEYANPSNREDDLAIISATYNHFGYMADDAGNTRAAASALSGTPGTGAINQVGLIERTGDADFYTFFTNGGLATISAGSPSSSPNLDLVLELQDSTGTVIRSDNPVARLNASVTATLPFGQYYVKVSPTGVGDPLTTGYTNYASLGQYLITGNVAGLTQNPIITSAGTASGQVGVSFGYRIRATGNPTSFGVTGALPPGLTLDAASGAIVGFPTASGAFSITVSATNASGTGTKPVMITIVDAALTLGEALDYATVPWTTTPTAPWVGQKTVTSDGTDAAQAPVIGDGEEGSFSTTVTGPLTAEFQWKVSSEENGDFLSVSVDDVEIDAISGVVDWTLVSVPIDAGVHTIKWTYRKNSSISQDPDTAWVDAVRFLSTNPPAITSAALASSTVGAAFNYQIVASNTPASFALASGTLPLGLKFDGTLGIISGVPAVATNTVVNLTATNNAGTSQPLALTIDIAASAVTLAQALDDVTAGAFAVSAVPAGAAKWFPQTVTTRDGVDALQSGPLGLSESTSITKTVSGIQTVNFWWKVECNPSATNRVSFIVNGNVVASLTGITGWENVSVLVGPGTHTVTWTFSRDNSASLGADAAWLDQVVFTTDLLPVVDSLDTATGTGGQPFSYQITASNSPTFFEATNLPDGLSCDPVTGLISGIPTVAGVFDAVVGAGNRAGVGTKVVRITLASPPVTLAQALNAPQLVLTTDPFAPWVPQTVVSFDGLHSARSGAIGHGKSSFLQTQVSGPATIKFRWTVDSEAARDFLRFYIDGQFKDQISGSKAPPNGASDANAWTEMTYVLAPGNHTLQWIYSKDNAAAAGRDAGWVDSFTVQPGSTLAQITSPLTATAYLGRGFEYQIAASNGPTSFVTGTLPAGLTLDGVTGKISGRPQTAGTFTVALSAQNGQGAGPSSSLVLTVASEPPGADNFANATALNGAAVSVEGTTVFASAETGEPAHAGRAAKSSLWYAWTAPLTGAVNITTTFSALDTVLSVYRGTTLTGLTVLAENDDDGRLVTSAVKINAEAGQTYLIAVDSPGTSTGKVVLNISYVAAGSYAGLAKDPNGTEAPGLLTLTLTPRFAFTGTLTLGQRRTPIRDRFIGEDFDGEIPRGRGVTPVKVKLHIDLAPGAEEITGRIVADGVTYNVFAKLALTRLDVPLALQRAFTFVAEPDDVNALNAPKGVSFGTATIDRSGRVKAVGTLADGTRFSGGSNLATDQTWLLYLAPYRPGGVFAGEVLVDGGGLFAPLSGTFFWSRAADARARMFGSGFGPTSATLKGYRFTRPARDARVLTLDPATQKLTFSFGPSDLAAAPAEVTAVLDTANRLAPVPATFRYRFVTSTGLFSGSTVDASGVTRVFSGALLQATSAPQPPLAPPLQDGGAGFYIGNTNTGAVRLAPTAP